MHDLRAIRENPDRFDAGLARRGLAPQAATILSLDERRRALTTELQTGQARRNEASKAIGAAMAKGEAATADALKAEVATLKTRLPEVEQQEAALGEELNAILAAIPNLPAADVPEGADEDDNALEKTVGEPPAFSFAPREHDDLGEKLGLDFECGVRLAGARFTVLRGQAALLNRALGQFMLDRLSRNHGYEIVAPPLLVSDEVMFGTGQLPKFRDDQYRTDDGRWLIPTAEVSLTNLVREQILSEGELPLRLTALTNCFRKEAGAAGRDTRGLIRQHQFEKVEMVSVVRPEDGRAELERMTRCAEGILEALGLPYRTIVLCTGDMGFGAVRTHDIEVWLPGQDTYREISSCSLCADFQARRMNARFRRGEGAKPEFLATLNGSGLAVGRTLIAVMENGQQADGSIRLPEVLAPYLGGRGTIDAGGRLV